MAEQYKRRRGDRRDGRLLRELDSLHYITGGLVYAMVYKIKSGDTENNHNIAEAFVRMHFGTLTEFIKTYKKKKVELAP